MAKRGEVVAHVLTHHPGFIPVVGSLESSLPPKKSRFVEWSMTLDDHGVRMNILLDTGHKTTAIIPYANIATLTLASEEPAAVVASVAKKQDV